MLKRIRLAYRPALLRRHFYHSYPSALLPEARTFLPYFVRCPSSAILCLRRGGGASRRTSPSSLVEAKAPSILLSNIYAGKVPAARHLFESWGISAFLEENDVTAERRRCHRLRGHMRYVQTVSVN
ncbi:hypothetical protein EVAR_80440_1 [Eumeta japonica]|uniref:Uncharacterized protein n=1 Tax=Eumeta variegata TaxID=151549 RepID=A0A4C1VKA1_EUMVA|nr:hypothetical protein EVAR_80440_1 [Eumeta japonica]